MTGDEPLGGIGEVAADDLRLRTNSEDIIARILLLGCLMNAASEPTATAPSVSQAWQAIMQSCEGRTPSSFSTPA
ncbi:hypothetical protein ABIB90_002565 [Bradyrhizobium sp. JR4.1]|uniref:hypothetical protein n=1 Tax=unclassified Bradyrhizobium TaxID=2631580 RepID=UPI00339A3A54